MSALRVEINFVLRKVNDMLIGFNLRIDKYTLERVTREKT